MVGGGDSSGGGGWWWVVVTAVVVVAVAVVVVVVVVSCKWHVRGVQMVVAMVAMVAMVVAPGGKPSSLPLLTLQKKCPHLIWKVSLTGKSS